MRSPEEIALALSLVGEGLNDCEISRRTDIPRGTIRDWRRGRIPRRWVQGDHDPTRGCSICGWAHHDPNELPKAHYAYLLGMYLGDGYLARHPRDVYRLRITLDASYPGIIAECSAAMSVVMRTNAVRVQQHHDGNYVEVGCYSRQWPCLLPQHGPGLKHRRPILLVDWQQEIADAHPKQLIRGLIHSDGCRFTNRVTVGGKAYTYPRYNFTNVSHDIRRIFCEACDRLGIQWRVMNARNISIARRASVACLDEFVGPKT